MMFVCKIFLAKDHLFEEIMAELAIYYVDMENIQHSSPIMQQVQYNKM